MATAKPTTKINRMASSASGSIVADSAITFTNPADFVATFGGAAPSFTAVNVSGTAPSSDTDFSMFPGSVAPSTGFYLVMTPSKLWFYVGGWATWRHSTAMLSS